VQLWCSVDPLAEKYPAHSPYVYTFNNPVRYTDPDGKEPTPYEAALMARHVYKGEGDLVGGWALSSVDQYMKHESNGLGAAMYQRTKSDGNIEYAYVYAGTEDMEDWGDNFSQPVGWSGQYAEVSKLSDKISKKLGSLELTFVGHSLGGGLANLSSLKTGRSAITFNPSWLSDATIGEKMPLRKGKSRRNFIHQNDPLNLIQQAGGWKVGLKQTGENIYIFGGWNPLKNNILNGHFMDTMIESMERNGQTFQHRGNGDDHYIEVSQSLRNF
jgi:hypothetical protein